MSDDYDNVTRGSLKLKGEGVKKKKKRKDKKVEKVLQQIRQDKSASETGAKKVKDTRTEAQKKFDSMQEKRKLARILEKASKTHKQRVEEFNSHLDSLTEHYDIPKVSWTK
ncbi:FAM32A (predicted) [Pycnogonum litorale]